MFAYPFIYINRWIQLYNSKAKETVDLATIKLKAMIVEDLDENFSKWVSPSDDINKLSTLYIKNLVIRNGRWDKES